MNGPGSTRPLRLAVIGLGDIAQKAYLPVLTGRDDVELTLMTRDPQRLDRIGRQYGVTRVTTSFDDVLAAPGDAAFVHAATAAHAELVEPLLGAGGGRLGGQPPAGGP